MATLKDCCLKRMPTGPWCMLLDGHQGECMAPSPSYGPRPPPADRRILWMHRRLVSRKWHPTIGAAWNAMVEGWMTVEQFEALAAQAGA